MRPHPWSPRTVPTIWIDYTTGYGYTGTGERVKPKVGERRQKPNLGDLLDTAASYGAERIMLTGKVPAAEMGPDRRHWLLVKTPGWRANGHWFQAPATGRFVRESTDQKVEVRTAAEWFGDIDLTPAQAREAWDATAAMVSSVVPGATLFLSPAATGTNLWALSLPKDLDPEFVTEDIGEEIHRTSGQHHLEHNVLGPNFSTHEDCVPMINPEEQKFITQFASIDGRFMYAALCRELGVGPGRRLNRADTMELMRQDPYLRARIYVKFRVPENWNHVGLLGVRHRNVSDGWYYPNRPGVIGETWADASEVFMAQRAGWMVDPVESVAFMKARPLDTFAQRMVRARERTMAVENVDYDVRAAVAAALRSIVIQSIGAFASRGRSRTEVVWSAAEVPTQYMDSVQRRGEAFIYKIPQPLSTRNRPFYRPELAAQVWGRGRARVLDGPGAGGAKTGVLTLPGNSIIGINGDAVYTTHVPQWALPDDLGGADDGKVGRLRLQGYASGKFQTPATLEARDLLKKRADRNGPQEAYELYAAQAAARG